MNGYVQRSAESLELRPGEYVIDFEVFLKKMGGKSGRRVVRIDEYSILSGVRIISSLF